MKTLPILSLLTGLAALIGLANCDVRTELASAPYSIDVAKGQRVKLKALPDKKDPVTEFENLLLGIAPADRRGTFVNLKRDDGREEEGPTAGNKFVPAPSPIGPDGSMHHTQKIQVQNQSDFTRIVDSFNSGTTTPTPGP